MYGDLVCRVTVLEESGTHHPRRDAPSAAPPPPQSKEEDSFGQDSIRISLVEAVLGGRVRIHTPGGEVHVSIPPGTSSGKTLRLKSKGPDGGDWHVRVEIGVPSAVDAESRDLIERFGALNPIEPGSD